MRRRIVYSALVTLAAAGAALFATQSKAAALEPANTVLILDSTVVNGSQSPEAQAAIAAGYDVEVVDTAGWSAKTTADFASYRAIVLGDPSCGSESDVQAAADTTAVWGPAIDGNVIIDGTDPVYHNGVELTNGAVRFAADEPGKTGAYISLSCYYDGTGPMTPVPVLDALAPDGFTVTGDLGCFDDVHIVASHPALAGITDEDLSGWGCSVHEAFDSWPDDFLVLAIALAGDSYTAPDGTVGTPYILARGESLAVISDITLAQDSSFQVVGEDHTVTATVAGDEGPVVGTTVTFSVVRGPHAGVGGTADTGPEGTATFTYTGSSAGTDVLEATFVDSQENTQTSNRLQVDWLPVEGGPTPPADQPPPSANLVLTLSASAPTASVGDPIGFAGNVTNHGPGPAYNVTVVGTVSQTVSLSSVFTGAGPCSVTGNAFTCSIGTLLYGGSATVTVSGTIVSQGTVLATMSASAEQQDPEQANNSASATIGTPPATQPGPFLPPVPADLPPPRRGVTVNVTPLLGIVLVNGVRLREGEQIPVGATVDTRKGRVLLQSANGTAAFKDGLFRIVEPRTRGGFTELRLLGGNFLGGCGHPARHLSMANGAETHEKKVVRRLWGNGTGRFRTSGRFSSATVRGTIWLTEDRCDGTLTRVLRGTVAVLDAVLKRKVLVGPGESYLARAPR